MKKNCLRKILTGIGVVGLSMLALAGCGKGNKKEGEPKEFTYIAEYAEMDLKCDYINRTVAAGDLLYISGTSWNEETDVSASYFYKYNMADGSLEELPVELSENSYINGMVVKADGNLAMVVNTSTYDIDENGEPVNWQEVMELWEISETDGKVLNTVSMDGIMNGEYAYVQNMCIDSQGNYYLSDGDSTIYVLNQEIQKLCEIKVDNWVDNMVMSKEGDIYVCFYGDTGIELRKVDLTAKALGEKVEGVGANGNQEYYTGASKSFLMNTSGKISLFDLTTGAEEELFDWLDVDVNSDNINMMGELSDGRIWAILNDYDSDGEDHTELVLAKKVKTSEVVSKEEITYGALYLDYNVKKNIIKFNKSNDKYRIVVKEYGAEDYQAGLTQFNADLTTGNCPDIIDLSAGNYSQYASIGILEDLYPYMEKSGMNKEDYLENVLKAFEVDGKLYGITPQFIVSTIMAKSSKVGDISGWTLSEMLDFTNEQNPDNLFAYGNRNSIFYYCIYNNIDEFINWETGECSFNGEDFIRTLEFAAQFPEEADYEPEEGVSARLRADKILLMQSTIGSVQEYQMMSGLFGEPTSYVGYPNNERKGNLIQPTGGCMGISSKSENKDGAWEFLQSMLTEEYQNSLVEEHGNWGFPVKKSALEKQFELDMTPEYYEDENGNQVEQMKTSWGYDDFNMDIYAAKQEEVDRVRELLMSAQKLSGSVNEQMLNIITEETESFFSGQKSAKDAADVIQNRIQIYVNENR